MISIFLNRRLGHTCLLLMILCPSMPYAHVPDAPKNALKTAQALNVTTPDFVLVNQDNQSFPSTQLRGKVVVLNFIFTTCTDVCPIFTANLAQLQRTLNSRYSGDVFFVSITTDPEVDSPKVLKAYAQRHNADFKNWAFLTGSEAELKRVWKSFGIQVIKKARGLVQHSSLTTVIDQQGIRRFNHYGEKWRVKDVEKDMLSLLEKKS
jgi:protein SCO1/2